MPNLEKEIGFYAQYHNNPINQWIHIIGVPIIMFTVLVWLQSLPPFMAVDISQGMLAYGPWHVNAALGVSLAYLLFFIYLEPFASVLYAPVVLGICYASEVFAANVENANMIALGLHVLAWVAQFIGHGVAEKRAPALLDSVAQAFLMAPLFVWLEVLFKLGYRKDLAQRIKTNAEKDIAKWKQSKSNTTVKKVK
ncbi:Endoplasmic reticulum membrane protein [Balamuthia mandrillaris]